MKLFSKHRSLFLAGSVLALVAGCTDADVETPGDGTPIVVNPIPPSGGGASGFAGRSTAPTSAADCPNGTMFLSNVALPSGATTNFCSLTPLGGGNIVGTVNVPFSADPILLSGTVFVGDAGGASGDLTIAAGQQFISQSMTGQVDLLVVSRGSTMNAVGTPTQPIIFTSAQDFEDDGMPNGTSGTGDWGGLAINGSAPLNECTIDPAATPGSDACRQNGEGGSGEFGGADAADSSGDFQYIRVQHAGFPFTPTNELNGVALQGVGNGTNFEFVQVHLGADDGFEWFGGTVNVNNLVVTGANDDSLDWTDGWTGALQFALVVQQPGNDNGIEGDNNGDTSNDAMPRSMPRLSNVTLIGDGPGSGEGIQLREGTAGTLVNAVITNFDQGLEFNPGGTGPNPTVDSIALAGNDDQFAGSGQVLFDAGANNQQFPSNSLDGVLPGVNENSVTATDPTTVDPFFVAANFVGAFSPTDTAENNFTTGWTVPGSIPGAAAAACPNGTTEANETPTTAGFPGRTEARICIINTPIAGDVALTPGNLYRIDGPTFVGVDGGADPASPLSTPASLTVSPGVTIFGNCGGDGASCGSGIVDLLTVSRGSQIFVNGSVVAPVVLTSRADLEAGGGIRSGATGEIGGLAINGRAPLNECTVNPAAMTGSIMCEQNGEGGSGVFGGATPDDNSGRINFLQVRYAGFPFTPTNELNSIALQGVGDGTEIDFVQVVNGADDGIEWFGGTVDVSHAVILGAGDDSIDWTDGWTGSLQFAIVAQNAGDDNGIEGDNNGDTSPDAMPRSAPTIANVTLIGDADATAAVGASGEGAQLREGTAGALLNAAIANFDQGLEFNPAGTGPNPAVDGVALLDNDDAFAGSGATLDAGANIVTADPGISYTGAVSALVTTINDAADTAGAVAVDPSATDPALEAATYVGATENAADTWFAGWTIGL